jgi:hypothetical protein
MLSTSFHALGKFGLAVLTDEIVSAAKPKIEGEVASRGNKHQPISITDTLRN